MRPVPIHTASLSDLIATVYHKNRFFILYFPRRIDKSSRQAQFLISRCLRFLGSCRFSGIIRCSGVSARSSRFTVSNRRRFILHISHRIRIAVLVSGIDKFLIVVRPAALRSQVVSAGVSAAFGSSVAVPLIMPSSWPERLVSGSYVPRHLPGIHSYMEGLPP